MDSLRPQHIAPALLIFLLAALVAWLSFTQEPADAFLFPRAISVAFILLATWNLVRAATGRAKIGSGVSWRTAINIAPGLLVMFVLVFWGAKALGFYLSSGIAFLVIYTLYDPAPFTSLRDWIKRILVTALFIAIMYGLFGLTLQVYTPRGIAL